ncbi:MAG: ATP-binding protein [Fuerstiella sp.]
MPEPSRINVQIPSDTSKGLEIQEQIVTLMEKFEYSMRDIFAMRLALEEAVTNAIRHGNKSDLDKKVTIEAEVGVDRMHVEVEDEGEGFEPGDVPDPTADDYIDRPNGRGLLLMKAYLNRFEYTKNGRRLRMERERNSELPIIEDDE